MPSGREKAKMNIAVFNNWVEERYVANDWSAYVRGNKLNRTEIAKECCFTKSVLQQNPAIKSALKKLEKDLKDRGVFSGSDQKTSKRNTYFSEDAEIAKIKQRLHRIEQKNQSLSAENHSLKEKLKEHNILEEYLLETSRVPR